MRQLALFEHSVSFPKLADVSDAQVRENILSIWKQAHKLERSYGIAWYPEAREFAVRLSQAYGVRLETVTRVIAALSPNSEWTRNKKDAREIIAYWRYGREAGKPFPRLSAYRRNVQKAIDILEGDLEALKGNKVCAFAENILQPEVSDNVTVDGHALAIACATRVNLKSIPKINDSEYARFSRVYRETAESLGLRPLQLQAVTWLVWKRIYKV